VVEKTSPPSFEIAGASLRDASRTMTLCVAFSVTGDMFVVCCLVHGNSGSGVSWGFGL
jgi:hypothetical protein